MMKTIVFLLEEPSAREMLQGLLPRLMGDSFSFRFIVFEGKQDLEKNLTRRLRGWLQPKTTFVVLRDLDANPDCESVKNSLVQKCHEAGKSDAIVRLACRELESWYFGELAAVERALNIRGLADFTRRQAFRVPDQIANPAMELYRITNRGYQKVLGSRRIGAELSTNPNDNTSTSFRVFLRSMIKLKEET
ncbi:MAG: DUF4276 family protein [Planctomycetaceae bacterium]